MSAPVKPAKPESLGAAGRRSTRLTISIPISLSGKDASGHSFKENTRTITINKHGAKIPAVHQLVLGAEITIENRALGTTARGNVVWLGEPRDAKEPTEIGIQLIDPENIWGIEFPPEDWQEGAPTGPGGKRLEKPGPATPSPAAPATAKTPAGPVASGPASQPAKSVPVTAPRVPGAQAPASTTSAAGTKGASQARDEIGGAIAELLQQADKAIDERVKAFEERLAKLSGQVGIQTEVALQEAAKLLEEKTSLSHEKLLASFAERLRTSRSEAETLLGNLRELQQSCQAEVEKTQHNIKEASWQAVQSATEELSNKLQTELAAASTEFVEDTRNRVRDEASAAVEAFSKDANERLTKLSGEYLARVGPEIRALQTEAHEAARGQMSEFIQSASSDLQAVAGRIKDGLTPILQTGEEALVKLRVAGAKFEESLAASKAKYQEEITSYSAQILQQRNEELRVQAGSIGEASEQALKRAENTLAKAEEVQKIFEENVGPAEAHFKSALADLSVETLRKSSEEMQSAAGKINEAVANALESAQKASAEAREAELGVQKTLAESETRHQEVIATLTAKALEEARKEVENIGGTFQSQLDHAAQRAREKVSKDITVHAQEAAEQELEAAANDLQKQAADIKLLLKEEVEESGRALAAEAKEAVAALSRATKDSLREAGSASVEEFRSLIQKAAQEYKENSARELEGQLAELASKLRQEMVEQIQVNAEETAGRAAEQVNAAVGARVKEASDAVKMHVGSGAVFLKELEEQGRANLETQFEKIDAAADASIERIQQQISDFAKSTQEQLAKESQSVIQEFKGQLERAAQLMHHHSLEEIGASLQEAIDRLVEQAAAQLTAQAQENIAVIAEKLEERKETVVSEAEEALRTKLAQVFAAILEPGSRKTADREPAEEARKRR